MQYHYREFTVLVHTYKNGVKAKIHSTILILLISTWFPSSFRIHMMYLNLEWVPCDAREYGTSEALLYL